MKISIFSGGRGNKNLFKAFIRSKNTNTITAIVNGLDDGASTGDIRRLFNYNTHGISDFLKTSTSFSESSLIDLLDIRFPKCNTLFDKIQLISKTWRFLEYDEIPDFIEDTYSKNPKESYIEIVQKSLISLLEFAYNKEELLDLSDYKIGNIVFAHFLIKNELNFKNALKDFNRLCNTPSNINIVEASNVPLYLVGILKNGTLLPNEASVVLTRTTDLVQETFQISSPLSLNQIRKISSIESNEKIEYLRGLRSDANASPECLKSLRESDIIVFGSGTPFSSVLPSLQYLGVSDTIAKSSAPKILIANLIKETDNFLGVSYLIDSILNILVQSSKSKTKPQDFLTHVIISIGQEENSIDPDIEQVEKKFPWLKIIQGDFHHPTIKGTHDGSKVLNALLSIS